MLTVSVCYEESRGVSHVSRVSGSVSVAMSRNASDVSYIHTSDIFSNRQMDTSQPGGQRKDGIQNLPMNAQLRCYCFGSTCDCFASKLAAEL